MGTNPKTVGPPRADLPQPRGSAEIPATGTPLATVSFETIGCAMPPVFTDLLLGAALALSLRRFILPYVVEDDIVRASAPVTMVASAVFLAALALTCADKSFWSASVTLTGGALLAFVFDDRWPKLAVTAAAACLLVYLGMR